MRHKILIIGFGVMGQAIARRIARHKDFVLTVADVNAGAKRAVAKKIGLAWESDFKNIAHYSAVFIAVKPQDVFALAQKIKTALSEKSLLISIAAGVSLKKLEEYFAHKKTVRVMPNLGISVGYGIAVWKTAKEVALPDKNLAKKIFSTFTENFEVKSEKEINAATAISGSGPAYFFYLAKNLEKSAMDLGFKPKEARLLVEKTLSASAFLQKGRAFDELIKTVASKKGTTEAALKVFKKYKADQIIQKAVAAAFKRAENLNNG